MHWKIGEFSRFTRVSIKMLRHYDELGLLKPAAVDPASGYRLYTVDQLPLLNRIIALKDLGFGLDAIGALLRQDHSPAEVRASLLRRRAEVRQRIAEEQRRLAQLEMRLRLVEEQGAARYEVVLRAVPAQQAASIRAPISDMGAQIPPIFDEVERYAAAQEARAVGCPLLIFHDLEHREGALDLEAAVPLSQPIAPCGRVGVREIAALPAAACVIYSGAYQQTDDVLQTLLRWVDANGYRVAGPLREVYLRFGIDDDARYELPAAFLAASAEQFVTELQLPVAAG
jgi:DNA-binding transcriptional MerR regulator